MAVKSTQWQSKVHDGSQKYMAVKSTRWQSKVHDGSQKYTMAVKSTQWQSKVHNAGDKIYLNFNHTILNCDDDNLLSIYWGCLLCSVQVFIASSKRNFRT